MTLQSALTVLSIVTASLILLVGMMLLTGLFLPGQMPDNYRYTLGGLMSAYAVYRIWILAMKLRRRGAGNGAGDGRV